MDDIIFPGPEEISSLISAAHSRIKTQLPFTPVRWDEHYQVWLKCENQQATGSFKWRGALSKLSLLSPGQTVITASTGNHGLGVATASALYSLKPTIFIPSSASQQKIKKLRELGANLQVVEGDSLQAELSGKEYAALNGLTWVSPYNDLDVIAGQGTIGLELTEQISSINRVYVTVGGGGLISGIAGWIKKHHPHAEIVGCQPVNSPEMYLSIQEGHVVQAPESLPTLSDGSAGPLEEDSITFGICQKLVDRFILIKEQEIETAIRYAYYTHQQVIEGAAGVALAAAMNDQVTKRENAVVILCGGNIDPAVHERIIRS